MSWKGLALFLSLTLAPGCTVGPDYQRTVTHVPEGFRGAEPGVPHDSAGRTFGDIRWFELLEDPDLQLLIRIALKENHDVRIAAQRILEYQARLTSTRSSLFPTVQAGGKYLESRSSEQGLSPVPDDLAERSAYQLFADLSWEIDFFGRVRRATEASAAEFFAAEENYKFIIQTLITGLARAYIELLAFDLELEIARRAVQSRQDSYRLVKIRQQGGVDSLLALRQAEGLVHAASRTIPDLERQVDQKENEITALLGGNPGPVRRGKLLEQHLKVEVPPGLPSSLLERRPDIRTAEELSLIHI